MNNDSVPSSVYRPARRAADAHDVLVLHRPVLWCHKGSVALSLCTTSHPLHTKLTSIFGACVSETTMRLDPRRHRRDDPRGGARAPSHCRVVPPLTHSIPNSLTYSVPVFLKRQCGRTLGGARADAACAGADRVRAGAGHRDDLPPSGPARGGGATSAFSI